MMLGRNFDFFAVLVIALGLLSLSKLPVVAFPRVPAVQFRQTIAPEECSASAALSQIAALLDR